ncbi:MAG TPA: carbohydrate binding family 9 domain-containing protein [Vicinamibacterales bacterium]|nr:carbohydrate binding family 9 domain-containing protein [Vicinamibacterales bacterium]
MTFALTFMLLFIASAPIAAQPQAPSSAPASAQASPRRTMHAVRLAPEERIVVDGRLDDEAWSRAVPARDFVQQDPDNGQPATEPTEVRILFTSTALYMGVTAYDSEPEEWLGYHRRRDDFLQSDDRFMWNIDTFNNQQTGYFFEMNPSGLMGDALRGANFNNRQWDGIWTGKARRTNTGWTLEIEIPFSTLNFDPEADAWGINFQRTVRRKNEESVWSGWLRNQGLNRLSNAGLLLGLEGIAAARGLDVKPYLLGTSAAAPGRGHDRTVNDLDVGGDVFYNPTPGVRTNLTINTDFAQTEVDQRLTNLERFPQFFPEKRDFFLDGSTFFDFQSTAGNDNSLLPFFTRRIGLNQGVPQQIRVGGKLAGQFGSNDVGAMYVRTGQDEDVFGENFFVARGKRRMLRQSYVGALYTGRHAPEAGADLRHTIGADFLFATSSFLGGDNLGLGGFLLHTSNPRADGRSNAYGLRVEYPNDPWSGSLVYREIQENYDAAVGFTPRTGFRRLSPEVLYTRRPRGHRLIRSMQYGVSSSLLFSTLDNGLLNRDFDVTIANVATHRQDQFQVKVLPTFERLEKAFAISRGITLPAGSEYNWTRYRVQVTTAPRRMVAVNQIYEFGGFYNGTRQRVATDLNVRIRPGVIIYTSAEWNRVDLDEGRFETRLFRVIPELQFSPSVSWVNNIQYDTQSAVLGWQSRFRWIVKPGSDLYVVYTHNWVDDPLQNRFATLDRRAATKVLYTHRF